MGTDETLLAAPPSLRLDILVYQEEGKWVGHCMQLDVVGTGDTQTAAYEEAVHLSVAQLQYAYDHDSLEQLFRPPEPGLLGKLFAAKSCGTLRLSPFQTVTDLPRPKGTPKPADKPHPDVEVQRLIA